MKYTNSFRLGQKGLFVSLFNISKSQIKFLLKRNWKQQTKNTMKLDLSFLPVFFHWYAYMSHLKDKLFPERLHACTHTHTYTQKKNTHTHRQCSEMREKMFRYPSRGCFHVDLKGDFSEISIFWFAWLTSF